MSIPTLTEDNGFVPLPREHPFRTLHAKMWPSERERALEFTLIPHLDRIALAPAEGPGELSEEENGYLEKLRHDPASRLAELVYDYEAVRCPPDDPLAEAAFFLPDFGSEGEETIEAFIDLDKHPELAVGKLAEIWDSGVRRTLLVRREHTTLARCIFAQWPWQERGSGDKACGDRGRRFFWTGQPGIGKSLGIYYMLFLCLSLGIPVITQLDADETMVFSSEGAFTLALHASNAAIVERRLALKDLATKAWSLHDVDEEGWKPKVSNSWPGRSQVFLWASSPNQERKKALNHLRLRNGAVWIWNMAPWSASEMILQGIHSRVSSQEVFRRVAELGPIPRSVFQDVKAARHTALEDVVREALFNYLQLVPVVLSDGARSMAQADVIRQVFLVGPRRVEDENDNYRTALFEWRAVVDYTFLSPKIARMTMQEFVKDKVRAKSQLQQLTSGMAARSTFVDQLMKALVQKLGRPADQLSNL